MRIGDIVKLQVYMNANGKDYDVVKELLGGVKKEDEEDEDKVSVNVKKAIKDIVELSGGVQDMNTPRTPMWDGIWTKRAPAMSDEEFEKSIVALAVEYAEKMIEIGNSGKSASMINRELFDFGVGFTNGKKYKLEVQYISVVSPDRKAAYAKADFTNTYSVYGNETNICGENELMRWSNQGDWSIYPTDTEISRLKKFNNLFTDTLEAYEKEHGVTIPSSTLSRAFTPPRSYY